MTKRRLTTTRDARDFLTNRFTNQHRNWFQGAGQWPLSYPLGAPSEKDVAQDFAAVRSWVEDWKAWPDAAEVEFEERQWPRIGRQSIPVRLSIADPARLAEIVGNKTAWTRACQRRDQLAARWPQLDGHAVISRHYEVLANYTKEDFDRLISFLEWVLANPQSGMYLRQLPISGLDTKWAESRKGVIADLLHAVQSDEQEKNFYSLCGLSDHKIALFRFRLLCPNLRKHVGGIDDFMASIKVLAALQIRPKVAFIVENLITALSIPEMEGAVVFMGPGNSAIALREIPWLHQCKVVYWGDIDTHGFAILDRTRRALPHTVSVLMDERTLLGHQSLWGDEASQIKGAETECLTVAERAVLDGLKENKWGENLRLEQERIHWQIVRSALSEWTDNEHD